MQQKLLSSTAHSHQPTNGKAPQYRPHHLKTFWKTHHTWCVAASGSYCHDDDTHEQWLQWKSVLRIYVEDTARKAPQIPFRRLWHCFRWLLTDLEDDVSLYAWNALLIITYLHVYARRGGWVLGRGPSSSNGCCFTVDEASLGLSDGSTESWYY